MPRMAHPQPRRARSLQVLARKATAAARWRRVFDHHFVKPVDARALLSVLDGFAPTR
jgi:hypothetical protein